MLIIGIPRPGMPKRERARSATAPIAVMFGRCGKRRLAAPRPTSTAISKRTAPRIPGLEGVIRCMEAPLDHITFFNFVRISTDRCEQIVDIVVPVFSISAIFEFADFLDQGSHTLVLFRFKCEGLLFRDFREECKCRAFRHSDVGFRKDALDHKECIDVCGSCFRCRSSRLARGPFIHKTPGDNDGHYQRAYKYPSFHILMIIYRLVVYMHALHRKRG